MYFTTTLSPLLVLVMIMALVVSASGQSEVRDCKRIQVIDPFPSGDFSVLYPYISEVALRTHFFSHQVGGYVRKLNDWLKGSGGATCPTNGDSLLLALVKELPQGDALHKAASQAYNHALYFATLRKNRTLIEVAHSNQDDGSYVRVDGSVSEDDEEGANIVTIHGQQFRDESAEYLLPAQPRLMSRIKTDFGSLKEFTARFSDFAVQHFASGWIWLLHNPKTGQLTITDTHDGNTFNNGETSEADPRVPIAVLDVWEHAYYLDYQAKRVEYVDAWFKAVDWRLVQKRLDAIGFEEPKPASVKREYTYPAF